jgi:hypothetical protein
MCLYGLVLQYRINFTAGFKNILNFTRSRIIMREMDLQEIQEKEQACASFKLLNINKSKIKCCDIAK